MKKVYFILAVIFIIISTSVTIQNSPSEKKVMNQLKTAFGLIPSGNVILDNKSQNVQSFYMSKTVVTNKEYQEFLKDLNENGENEIYEIAKIDSSGWRNVYGNKLEAYATHYHKHSAYQDFPAVNVSKEGAKLYCEWLTEKTNKLLPKDQQVKFNLPLKSEWLRAAEGTNSDKIYTWEGPYLRNSKGVVLANFINIQESAVSRDVNGDLIILKDLPIALEISKSIDI